LCEGTVLKAQHTALATVGFLLIPENVGSIRSTFQNARFRTVFDSDLPGMVLACKVALWLKGIDASFLISSNQVIFTFKSGEFHVWNRRFHLIDSAGLPDLGQMSGLCKCGKIQLHDSRNF